MTIEEKAKAYDEAFERARKIHNDTEFVYEMGMMEEIFPELKENEDERIRKDLMQYISELNQDVVHLHPGIETCNKWIAWLEKQGKHKEINLVEILKHYPKETELYSPLYGKLWLAEVDEENEIITCYKHPLNKGCTRAMLEQEDTISFYSNGTTGLPDFSVSKACMLFLYDIEKPGDQKPVDKVEPKFREGDWITNGQYTRLIVGINGDWPYYMFEDGTSKCIKDIDKKYHLWTIKDSKEGDILATKWGVFIVKECSDTAIEVTVYCGINTMGQFDKCDGIYPWTCERITPATKEQCDILFKKMKEAGYEWTLRRKN